MQRHCENARAVAGFLDGHAQVEQVFYPGLEGHPGHDVAASQMSDYGGMVSFLAPSVDDAVALVARTKIWKLAESLGGVESLIEHPAIMAILGWAKEAVSRGYVALVLDSLGPRRVDTVCYGANGGVNFPRGVRDALQAAEHLRKLPYVDRDRVAFVAHLRADGAHADRRRLARAVRSEEAEQLA